MEYKDEYGVVSIVSSWATYVYNDSCVLSFNNKVKCLFLEFDWRDVWMKREDAMIYVKILHIHGILTHFRFYNVCTCIH